MKSKFLFSSLKPPRNSNFSHLSPSHLTYFQSILKPTEIITDPADLPKYNIDWMDKYHGSSKLVLQPHTVPQISQILSYSNSQNLAVVPQGGNTGLVGGGTSVYDEIVLSLRNLNKIKKFDKNNDVLSCESGCILQDLNSYVKEFGYEVPIDLGARGSCFIGGNLATNAGGKYFIRHGPLRGNLLGMQVVLANGSVLNMDSGLRKDNTGYDLRQIFVGSEGTLGIITACDIVCKKRAKQQKLMVFTCDSFEKILALHDSAKTNLNMNLSAFEYMDPYAYKIVMEKIPRMTNPFPNKDPNFFVALLEVIANQNIDQTIEGFYSAIDSAQLFKDAIISENDSQFEDLWKIRESVAEACNKVGLVYKYDLSLPIDKFDTLTQETREKTKNMAFTTGYGHIGDGNIHINVGVYEKKNNETIENMLEPWIFQWVRDRKGSISAEHGLGLMKGKYLEYCKEKEVINVMRGFKQILDPKGILNPYKVLP